MENRLEEYDSYFDYYAEHGTMPHEFQRDVLTDYMLDVLNEPSNKQLCSNDIVWRESIKKALLDFFEQMLLSFKNINRQKQQELKLLQQFEDADIDEKREMWSNVVKFIKSTYTASQVNMAAYSYQLGLDGSNKDVLFGMMCDDWRKACNQRFEEAKQEHLNKYRQQFETSMHDHGSSDYESIMSTQKVLVKFPVLKEIINLMGREKENHEEERDSTITRYKPQLLSRQPSFEEVEGIEEGNNLSAVLPSEIALLSDTDTETLFYHKFAAKQLQMFSCRPKSESREKSTEKHSTPRLNKGPIILSIDTSGSMQGRNLNYATSLMMQILLMAKRQKRRCFLITFSVRARSIDLSRPGNWRLLDKFMAGSFTGGTDGEQMLSAIISTLNSDNFSMADALIISDFEFPIPSFSTRNKIIAEQQKGTRFYGLGVTGRFGDYNTILDRMWALR